VTEALGVMGDVYSSALGTTVVRHCTVPPRPPELDGEVVVLVKKGGPLDTAEAAPKLQAALSTHGELVANGTRYEQEKERWRVRFATHAAAEAAVATFRAAAESAKIAGAEAIFMYYNGRPYDERGCEPHQIKNTHTYHHPYAPSLFASLLCACVGVLCITGGLALRVVSAPWRSSACSILRG
jgi:hypothetical protein